jgi:hypothetical protein
LNSINSILPFIQSPINLAHEKCLEVLLAPNEAVAALASLGIHIAFDVQLASQSFGSAEEDTTLSRRVDLADGAEYHVPVGAAEVRWGSKARDGVVIATVEDDVAGIGG